MKLSVITVTWNSKEHIGKQIESVISGAENMSYEQIVIDNNSSDTTLDFIKEKYPDVICIQNDTNTGFSHANNQGYAIAKGEYLLFLNPDMHVEKDSLVKLVQWMDEHKDVGIVSPKLIDEQGNFNREASPRRFPKLSEQIALLIKLPHLFPSILDNYLMKDFHEDTEQEVDSVRGAFMLVRREFLQELGFAFDPRYYIWYEDVDICREAKKHGWKVMYTPIISCVDFVGQSFKKRTSLWKQKNFSKSMLVYFQKWEPWYTWMWIALFRPFGIGLAWLGEKISK
ncbi:MAG: glycosyltransferase family 2 protein [Candidatus Magasanikbacteria bacterium]